MSLNFPPLSLTAAVALLVLLPWRSVRTGNFVGLVCQCFCLSFILTIYTTHFSSISFLLLFL